MKTSRDITLAWDPPKKQNVNVYSVSTLFSCTDISHLLDFYASAMDLGAVSSGGKELQNFAIILVS